MITAKEAKNWVREKNRRNESLGQLQKRVNECTRFKCALTKLEEAIFVSSTLGYSNTTYTYEGGIASEAEQIIQILRDAGFDAEYDVYDREDGADFLITIEWYE